MKSIFTCKVNVFIVFIHVLVSSGQSIRKDYREFTNQEMIDFRAALQSMKANGDFDHFAHHHAMHYCSPIHTNNIVECGADHTGELFLPWHRFLLLDFEWRLRNTASNAGYLSLPYWDWRTDNSMSPYWHTNFLSSANLPNFSFTRCLNMSTCAEGSSFPYLATTANIDACLGLTPFWNNTIAKTTNSPDFSHRLEHYHDRVHIWVGGTMSNGQSSPADPIFYLHHNMIDKIWQDWENKFTGLQASFPNGAQANMPNYSNVYANNMKDSRGITNPEVSPTKSRLEDVWFAYNKKVIMDGANGVPFVCGDASKPYVYRYTAAIATGAASVTGAMYVGDVQRNGNDSIVMDNKGGFVVKSGAKVSFLAGGSVTFLPGFNSDLGAVITAKTITVPSGTREVYEASHESSSNEEHANVITIFPNPVTANVINFSKTVAAVRVINLAGIEVLSGKHLDKINVETLAKGIYILYLEETTHKIVIE